MNLFNPSCEVCNKKGKMPAYSEDCFILSIDMIKTHYEFMKNAVSERDSKIKVLQERNEKLQKVVQLLQRKSSFVDKKMKHNYTRAMPMRNCTSAIGGEMSDATTCVDISYAENPNLDEALYGDDLMDAGDSSTLLTEPSEPEHISGSEDMSNESSHRLTFHNAKRINKENKKPKDHEIAIEPSVARATDNKTRLSLTAKPKPKLKFNDNGIFGSVKGIGGSGSGSTIKSPKDWNVDVGNNTYCSQIDASPSPPAKHVITTNITASIQPHQLPQTDNLFCDKADLSTSDASVIIMPRDPTEIIFVDNSDDEEDVKPEIAPDVIKHSKRSDTATDQAMDLETKKPKLTKPNCSKFDWSKLQITSSKIAEAPMRNQCVIKQEQATEKLTAMAPPPSTMRDVFAGKNASTSTGRHATTKQQNESNDLLFNTPEDFWNPFINSFKCDDPRKKVLIDYRLKKNHEK